jgi:hypothetical protein
MASQLKRDLAKMNNSQSQVNKDRNTVSKGGSPRPKAGGTAKFGNKTDPTGAARSPLSAPKAKAQTAQQRYFKTQPTGKKAPKGVSGLKGPVKGQLIP